MNLDDKIRVYENLLNSLELQKKEKKQIAIYQRKIDLKKSKNPPQEVYNWTVSELEALINKHKDYLHEIEKTYKELLQKLVNK